ncbi:MAG: hypothetical protein JST16_09135 [Bdellovibrionales bacterium]|nr:hypothetical protein [Bdellovibrionales bacterium]
MKLGFCALGLITSFLVGALAHGEDNHSATPAAANAAESHVTAKDLYGYRVYTDANMHQSWVRMPGQLGCLMFQPQALCDSLNSYPPSLTPKKTKWRVARPRDFKQADEDLLAAMEHDKLEQASKERLADSLVLQTITQKMDARLASSFETMQSATSPGAKHVVDKCRTLTRTKNDANGDSVYCVRAD